MTFFSLLTLIIEILKLYIIDTHTRFIIEVLVINDGVILKWQLKGHPINGKNISYWNGNEYKYRELNIYHGVNNMGVYGISLMIGVLEPILSSKYILNCLWY